MCILSSLEKNSWNCCALLPSPDGTGYFPFVYRRFSFKSRVHFFNCVLVFVPLQPNPQPGQRPSITPSRVGHNPAANCATEPSTTDTLGPRTHTVHIRRTRLTHTPSSPTGSGTGAFMSTRSWAPCREVARPPRLRPLRDPGTLRNCSPTHPSPPRAARGARAAPRATAPRFPQRRRMVRHRLFIRIPYYKYLIGKLPRRESHCGASASPPPPPRLLCSLYPGLPVLRVSDSVQHRAGLRHLRLLCRRRLLLLLLLRLRGVRRLRPAVRHGLWHPGCLLRVCRLPGDLHGVLQSLLLLLRAPSHRAEAGFRGGG